MKGIMAIRKNDDLLKAAKRVFGGDLVVAAYVAAYDECEL